MPIDIAQTIATGFATGIGVSTASWLHERHLKERLDSIYNVISKRQIVVRRKRK